MSELIELFVKLREFFDGSLTWEQVEELYEREQNDDANIRTLPLVQRATKDSQVLSTMLELCTTIRGLRGESSESYDNTYDSWDQVVKICPRDSYLCFVYTLSGLAMLDATSSIYTKLSLAAVNTYFLSLTIPGSKGFHVFDEDVMSQCLEVFTLLERIQRTEVVQQMPRQQHVDVWIRVTTFCDDLKLVLRYVHLKDHSKMQDLLLRKLIELQYQNHERGYANHYAANLHTKCFEIFEEMINAHNGEPEETLAKLMNYSVMLHTYATRPKNAIVGGGGRGESAMQGEHISDWFIKCIDKYPSLLVKQLNFYIECIVTNPVSTWKTEQTQRALDYAAKYDAALFTKCNETNVKFLCDAIRAEEVMIRTRAIELIGKILQLESNVNWQMFRHEVSAIPREVYLLKELIESLQDNSNSVKLKAVQALQAALMCGSPHAKTILTECLRFARFSDDDVVLPDEPRVRKNEIRYRKPDVLTPEYSFTGHEILSPVVSHLPDFVYKHLYQNPMSYIRRAGIMFAEQMVRLNPFIIFNTSFVAETTRLVNEPTALVRKQTIVSVDSLHTCYPNCFHIIWVWCKIISPMFKDSDAKNVELAMQCFYNRVLLNIKSIDQATQAKHFIPWMIIRTLLTTQSRLYLLACFHAALPRSMVSTQILSVIESHLHTSYSTEAWVLLNFVSGKVKSKVPDALVSHFLSLNSWDMEANMSIALEVLATCIKDFSHTALNRAFNHILTSMQKGELVPSLISKAFDFLIQIAYRSRSSNSVEDNSYIHEQWIMELNTLLENRILLGINEFPSNRFTFMSQLYAYSQVNLHTPLRPNSTIISFVHKYIAECIKMSESELNLDNEQLFNLMIQLAGRFSLRSSSIATTTCSLYSMVLQKIDRPPIVNTVIIALMDLCKKHTQIVERIIIVMLQKLCSSYEVNRMETFKCFQRLILEDQLKLRGSLLVMMLATILDDSQEVGMRACNFFDEYLSKKNATLFQKCLVECPFVLNEYKNFDSLDSFSETTIKSPLKGEAKRRSRQILYNYMMKKIDDINLILYFGQLKLIAEKCQHDPLIKTDEGVALVKDVLYIMRRVCQLTKEQKANAVGADDAENAEELADETERAADAGASAPSSSSAGVGRGRRRREITMPQALTQLEKSLMFVSIIHEKMHDETLTKSFDDLCKWLAKRFPNLIEYAQPASFWDKYREAKVSNPQAVRKATKRKSQNIQEDVSDFSSDDDMPLAQAKIARVVNTSQKTQRNELLIKYLFQPNI